MTGRPELGSHGALGEALLVEVVAALSTLRRLIEHPALGAAPEMPPLRTTVEQVERRLALNEVAVVVAGERGAGKSSFIDAILGDRRLSAARGATRVTTFIRKADRMSFRARRSGGNVVDFAERFVDRSAELEAELEAAEVALREARTRWDEARAAFEAASARRSAAESGMREASSSLESAGENAIVLARGLGETQALHERLGQELAALERVLPRAVLEAPPAWALWQWLLRAIFWLFARRRVKRYRTAQVERRLLAEKLNHLADQERRTSARQTTAETELVARAESLHQSKTETQELFERVTRAEAEHERALAKRAALADELERHRQERTQQFFAELRAISNPKTRGKNVVEIEIGYPARWLPEDIVLVDAPALFDAGVEEQARAWVLISDRADGCVLISELDRAVSESTKRFLQKMREVVPHVLLVLTKMDKAFVAAMRRGGSEPWEQVEHARRIGTRRFAREIGRPPEAVLSIAVAAEAAIDDARSGLARRFQMEIDKLFELLRHERALILGTRAASVARRCIQSTADVEKRAADAYAARIAALEQNRLPDPDAFRKTELALIEPAVEQACEQVLAEATAFVADGFELVWARCAGHFGGAKRFAQILEAAARSERELSEGVAGVERGSRDALEQSIDGAVRAIEMGMFERLRVQYQLIHDVRRSQSSLPRLEQVAIERRLPEVAVVPRVQSSVAAFTRLKWALGAVGVVLAAGIGTLLAPGLGTLAGAAVGPLLSLVPTRGALKRRSQAIVADALDQQRAKLVAELVAGRPAVATAIAAALERSLARVMQRFGRFIAEPLQAEQEAIDRERALLSDLAEIRAQLAEHDQRLGERVAAAAEASIGICR